MSAVFEAQYTLLVLVEKPLLGLADFSDTLARSVPLLKPSKRYRVQPLLEGVLRATEPYGCQNALYDLVTALVGVDSCFEWVLIEVGKVVVAMDTRSPGNLVLLDLFGKPLENDNRFTLSENLKPDVYVDRSVWPERRTYGCVLVRGEAKVGILKQNVRLRQRDSSQGFNHFALVLDLHGAACFIKVVEYIRLRYDRVLPLYNVNSGND